ncbi:DUF2184 domain-containing protein, partial [Patescibacteria group bacterium]
MKKNDILGKELRNSAEAPATVGWQHGLELKNSNGNVDPSTLGYQYTIQTTTQIRAEVIQQKFYEVPIADFVPVIVGTGAWMENIKTNLVYQLGGKFERGIQDVAAGPSQIATVDVGVAPVSAKIVTWAMGYQYATPEVEKALASNNWDVISAKMGALKKTWDLGIQQIAFLGLLSDLAEVPGLLSNASVTVNLSVITKAISDMTDVEFSTLVKDLVAAYFANSN